MKSVLKQRREQYQRQDLSHSSFKSETGNGNERNGMAVDSFKETSEMEKQLEKSSPNSPASIPPSKTSSNTPTTPEQPKVIDMLERRKLIFQDSSSSESSDMEFSD